MVKAVSKICLSSQKLLHLRSQTARVRHYAKSCSTVSKTKVTILDYLLKKMYHRTIIINIWGNLAVVNARSCIRIWCGWGKKLVGRLKVSASQPQVLCKDRKQKARKRAPLRRCQAQETMQQTHWSHNKSIISSLYRRRILPVSQEKMSSVGVSPKPRLITITIISESVRVPRNPSTVKASNQGRSPPKII